MHTSLAQSRFCFQQKKNKYQTITPESSQDPPVEANSITTFCSLLLNTYTAHLYRSHQAQFALCVYTSSIGSTSFTASIAKNCFHAVYLSKMLSIRGACLEYNERKENNWKKRICCFFFSIYFPLIFL